MRLKGSPQSGLSPPDKQRWWGLPMATSSEVFVFPPTLLCTQKFLMSLISQLQVTNQNNTKIDLLKRQSSLCLLNGEVGMQWGATVHLCIWQTSSFFLNNSLLCPNPPALCSLSRHVSLEYRPVSFLPLFCSLCHIVLPSSLLSLGLPDL